ncbi:MAG: twin-arginine translocation signal domain-containing protein [Rhizobiales bacterium]|nr:twin-arginine translocation signal domain-containing protein [Hyphomicrobiales bacterium]
MRRNRREFIGALAASGAVLASTSGARSNPVALDVSALKKEADFACLYHCDFGDPQRFSQMLNNVNNHLTVYDFDPTKIKIVVVAHAAGLKFFLQDLSGTPWEKETIDGDLYKRFTGLSKYGVEGYLCQITYKRLKIDPSKTRTDAFLKFVPSGVATVAELQAKGFGYLKVG